MYILKFFYYYINAYTAVENYVYIYLFRFYFVDPWCTRITDWADEVTETRKLLNMQ